MSEPDGIDWPHPDDLKPPQYGTSMHFPSCLGGGCTGCLPPLDDLVPPADPPASPFFAEPAAARDPIVKYDGNGQPMRADGPRLGNRAQRRAMAREARRRR